MSPETKTPTADPAPLLALAREQMAWRENFQAQPPAEQEAIIQQQARMLAICASDIGKAALWVGGSLDALIEAARSFLHRWPNANAAKAATLAAITGAGLAERPDWLRMHHDRSQFEHTGAELRTWLPVLEVMSERLEECEKSDTATDRAEWDERTESRAEQAEELNRKLLAAFLSEDARKLLSIIAGHKGPLTAKAIVAAVDVERSKCYVLIAELRERGLIAENADGYEHADAELWEVVQQMHPEQPPFAPRAAA